MTATNVAETTYDLGTFRFLVAAWSARCFRPHSIIEDRELRQILTMLFAAVHIHSRQTVSKDISDMYERSRRAIALHLRSLPHRIHLTLDGWTSSNIISFLGVTVRYFEKGTIHGFVLDFVRYAGIFKILLQQLILVSIFRMSKRHTGINLARELEQLLKSFGIEDKVIHFILHLRHLLTIL